MYAHHRQSRPGGRSCPPTGIQTINSGRIAARYATDLMWYMNNKRTRGLPGKDNFSLPTPSFVDSPDSCHAWSFESIHERDDQVGLFERAAQATRSILEAALEDTIPMKQLARRADWRAVGISNAACMDTGGDDRIQHEHHAAVIVPLQCEHCRH